MGQVCPGRGGTEGAAVKQTLHYSLVIAWSPEDQAYVVVLPILPEWADQYNTPCRWPTGRRMRKPRSEGVTRWKTTSASRRRTAAPCRRPASLPVCELTHVLARLS